MVASLAFLLCGCSNPAGNHDGVVAFDDGTPVQSGSIEFRSLADGSRYASRIASDGSFSLTDQDGEPACPPGDYEVVVVQIVVTEDLAAEDHQHGRTVPRRYADYYTSGLRATNAENFDSDSPIRITLETSDRVQ
ncbi:MAG: carboxypeptidase regulatory-like domain-containing protein [Rubripirellula sp.]